MTVKLCMHFKMILS